MHIQFRTILSLALASLMIANPAFAQSIDLSPVQNLLQGIVVHDPERAMQARFAIAPATRILRSPWPLFDIWAFNMQPHAPKPRAVAQDVLIARAEFDPAPHLLPDGAADWLEEIGHGCALGQAAEAALSKHPDFDLSASLTLALSSRALTDFTTKETP